MTTQANSLISQPRELKVNWNISWTKNLQETVWTKVSHIFSNTNIYDMVKSNYPGAQILDIKRNTSGHWWSIWITLVELELSNWTKLELELK